MELTLNRLELIETGNKFSASFSKSLFANNNTTNRLTRFYKKKKKKKQKFHLKNIIFFHNNNRPTMASKWVGET